ncbi:hypothetical protein K435DRAFT_807241 [Dendrothele bispora CBS 962.96]|uniref:Uncharacterized protein n=1 Tax=Dendrothele bispora (strain CBS 962.96) TaxID=1314807 RepID=A0A4S8L5A4_DENBC|nr:hypothetical protein K435DRAFT_807241 [Dendrothele bispora CBS 962.96]
MGRDPKRQKIECGHCKEMFDSCGISRHRQSCRLRKQAERERLELQLGGTGEVLELRDPEDSLKTARPSRFTVDLEQGAAVQTSNTAAETAESDRPQAYQRVDSVELEDTQSDSVFFIQIDTHPDANIPTKHIPLDSKDNAQDSSQKESGPGPAHAWNPWTPFRSRADFEFTEIAVRSNLPKETVNAQLHLLHTSWAPHSNITLTGYSDMEKTLLSARDLAVKFRTGSVTRTYRGKPYTFEFSFRDPWEWIVSLVTDPTLADSICWYPVRKYLHNGAHVQRLFDEPQTADLWWNAQDTIKKTSEYPHCFLLLLVWLDKGNVTRKVKLHPMIARASFLPSTIRNASGNGGGILLGYVPSVNQVTSFHDAMSEAEKAEQRNFKQQVYHGVMQAVFGSLQRPAETGECIKCADQVVRVLFPGIPYAALDGEEAWAYACTRASHANFPCPRCLVPHHKLDSITETFPLRTTASMKSVQKARAASTATEKSTILKSAGLHDVSASLTAFCLPCSDPYKAVSYDTLHKDDLGKFGKHIYPVVLKAVQDGGLAGKLNQNMNNVPSWSSLKHFRQITTLEYTDGKDMLHILKLVSKEYEKLFIFPKQHDVCHIIPDIREKGATHNYST